MKRRLYSVEFFNADGEPDGYFASLTDQQAESVRVRLSRAAKEYDLSEPKVFAIDLDETPDFDSIMDTIEERYPA